MASYIPISYVEDSATRLPRKFLPDREYADALEAFVVVCTDCVFINKKKQTFYLAKRKSKPLSEWWFIGGRSFAGETEIVSMLRCLKRETGLDIDSHRLEFKTMKRYLFKDRQQSPQDKGCDSLCYIYALEITDEELAQVNSNLDPNEYDTELGLQEFDATRLVKEDVFPPIVDLYELIFHATVERFGRAFVDTWDLLHRSDDTFENTWTFLSGKKEIDFRSLEQRIPVQIKKRARKLLDNKGGIELEHVHVWSKLSVLLGVTLTMHVERHGDFNIIHCYDVFPDGTVVDYLEERLESDKKPERRKVKWREIYSRI